MNTARATAIAILALLLPTGIARADVVRLQESEVVVLQNGSLDVTERIDVRTAGNDELPRFTRRVDRALDSWGNIEVIDVRRDGEVEDWRLIGNRIVSSADSDVLPAGTYDYVFRFRVPNQVEHLDDRDRIVWFATGFEPVGSINEAVVTFVLPPEVRIMAAGIGVQNIRPENGAVTIDSAGRQLLTFRSDTVLHSSARFPVFIDVAPGYFKKPGPYAARLWHLLRSNVAAGLVALLAVPAFFGVHIVLGYPRRSRAAASRVLSPAAVRFLRRGGFDATALLAAILDLVARGHATLRRTQAGPYIEPALDRRRAPALPGDEAAVYDRLFRTGEVGLPLSGNADPRLVDAAIVLKSALEANWTRRSPHDRRNWLIAGYGVAAASVLLVGATSAGPAHGLFVGGNAAAWSVAFAGFVWFTVAIFRALRRGERGLAWIVALFAPPVTLWVAYRAVNSLLESWETLGLGAAMPFVFCFLLTPLALFLLRPRIDRTDEAERKIAEMRQQLANYERLRPSAARATERDATAIDAFLPYAVALGARHEGFDAVADAMRGVASQSIQLNRWRAGDSLDAQILDWGVVVDLRAPR